MREAAIKLIPNQPCECCQGTGIRTDAVGVQNNQPNQMITADGHPRHGETGSCNGCDGRGWNRPAATHYDVNEDDVHKFVDFLRGGGGFAIF